jgi:hypothetical protein
VAPLILYLYTRWVNIQLQTPAALTLRSQAPALIHWLSRRDLEPVWKLLAGNKELALTSSLHSIYGIDYAITTYTVDK